MSYGEVLKGSRLRAGLTLPELAGKARISRTYLVRLESGKQRPPSTEVSWRLALALQIDPADLLWHSGRIPPEILSWYYENPHRFMVLMTLPQIDDALWTIFMGFMDALRSPTANRLRDFATEIVQLTEAGR